MSGRQRNWAISRRACLRSAGTGIGLPLLEAMLPGMRRARAAGAMTPKRVVFFVFNNGTSDSSGYTNEGRVGAFWPKTIGPDFEITKILEPLTDLKKDILVIKDLYNTLGDQPEPRGIGHMAANCLLTGVPVEFDTPDGPPSRVGISVDQFIANALKKQTPALPSLFLSHPVGANAEGVWVSWSDRTSRVYPSTQPSEVFPKIFGDKTVDEKTRQTRLANRKSVLHHVKADVDRLQKKLGKHDSETLNKYLASVLSLEEQISAPGASGGCAAPAAPPPDTTPKLYATDPNYPDYLTGADFNLPAHMSTMSDLVTLAFQCDITRVVTMQINTSGLRFRWLGSTYDKAPGDWHSAATHGGDFSNPNRENALDLYSEGSRSMVGMFGDLVRKLKNTSEVGGGSLLDNTVLVCCSDMAYGNPHSMHQIPVIVAGRAGGIRTGRFIAAPARDLPIYNLWVSVLNALDIEATSYGTSTGSIDLA